MANHAGGETDSALDPLNPDLGASRSRSAMSARSSSVEDTVRGSGAGGIGAVVLASRSRSQMISIRRIPPWPSTTV